MANPGTGSKFVSVNLNKSYGQRSSNLGGPNRIRSGAGNGGVGGGGGGGGGAGGGMVVLSRSRSSIVGVQKGGPKLSVPPPLNLPSLRKEHERTDPSSLGGGSAGGGNSGAGARPASSGIGWTKPASLVVQEKDIGNDQPLGVGSQMIGGSDQTVSRGNSVYMPPSARSGTNVTSVAASSRDFPPVQRAVVLRGEDFPSLQATLATASGGAQKQKDSLNTKQNQKASAELEEPMGNSYLRPPSATQPQNQSSRIIDKASEDKEGVNHRLSNSQNSEQLRKQDDFFPSPLPLVRLNHTSDWADDERDIGNGLPDRDRDQGYSKGEFNWDRDFDFPRSSVLPRTSIHDHPEGRGLRHEEVRRPPSGGFVGGNAYNRDVVRTPSREGRDGSSWRSPSLVKEGFGGVGNGTGARPLSINRENGKQNKYGQSSFGDTSRDGFNSGFSGTQDSKFARRDVGYGQGVRQTGNHVTESYAGRRVEQTKQDYYGRDLPGRRGDSFQNGSFKGLFTNDPILSVSKEKEKHPSTGKHYFEEPFAKEFGSNPDFDGRDPLTGVLVSVVKRKKDALKQADYHDPVRDSFEAELERVQKLQEQERQRIIEEQARALELARKEEEERERAAREEEERRRRHEEEVKQAAWRAEQERLDAVQKAEEQKLAREEEKRRMLLEEERRKEAARKKLMELEARIARRQAEVTKESESSIMKDERMPGMFQDKDVPRVDVVDWEDGERMVERITSSASSDSSNFNRSFEMSSRPHIYRDGDSVFLDKGKPSNSWRRDVFDNGNSSAFIWQDQDNAYRSPKRDAYGAGRSFARKEFSGGSGIMPVKASGRGGMSDPRMVDDFSHPRGNRWNLSGDVDPYNRNPDFDPEFHDNFADKFNDMGWGLGRPHLSHHPSYSERPYQNSDADGFSSFAKSRHSMRQPRVLPPPSMSSMNKNTFKSQIEPPRSLSSFRDSEMSYHHVTRNSEPILQMGYDASYQDERDRSRMVDSQEEDARFQDHKEAKTVSPRCDSQSSLSVSSAPSSPTHLSHDDLEDSRESPSLPTAAEGEDAHFSENENAASLAEIGTVGKVGTSSSLSLLEDEEWDVENHRDLLEQEEYDEEENGYREEDEVHEEGDENVDLPKEFEDLHLEEKDTANMKDNMVFGFDESVDVVMPSGDNSESKSGNGEKTIGVEQVSVGVSEEVVSPDGLPGFGQSALSENNSPKVVIESSQMTHEAERTLVNAPHNLDTSLSSAPESISSSISTVPPQQPLSSSVDTTMPSISQPTTSTVSACPSQTEVPVKLQFGLFSGPSLIPSPVSAIQIGSIQMPLHLNPPVGPSLTQLHPPQPPFFQFGQLRYASPIPQGIVPLGPQSMSFVQSSSPAKFSVNHNQNGSLSKQESQDPGIQNNSGRDKPTALSVDNEPGGQKPVDQPQNSCKVANGSSVPQRADNEDMVSNSQADSSLLGDRSTGLELTSQVERRYQSYERKNYRSYVANKESNSQLHVEHGTSQFISRSPGPTSGYKGKRYVVKNSGSRLSHPVSESSYTDFRGSQRRGRPKVSRTEFRVRENVDKRQRETVGLVNYPEADRTSFSGKVYGTSVQSGVSRASKQMSDVENMNSKIATAHNTGSESRREKHVDKEVPVKKVSSLYVSHSKDGNPKRSFDEDVDAPLQSGIVRIFNQPGIEAPSDDDDFIEVRSKRQMLNDRREQREKEIKAKSRVVKAPKKRRSVSHNSVASTMSNKTTSLGGETSSNNYSKPVSIGRRSLERPTKFTSSVVSPPLAPIGTPSANSDTQADIRTYTTKSTQAGSTAADIATVSTNLVPSISFENRNGTADSVATSPSPWGNARVTQQVMALTQTQLDEAMTPARFEKQTTSVGDRAGAIIEQNKQSQSFSSTPSPLNSLLAGERIQFGAVTSPTIFPLRSHIVSNGMGPPGSCRLDVPIEHNLSALENDRSLFFEKDKHLNESCVDLEDCEAEAEAAASAVAVAAISSDEIVGGGCSVSVSETKSFEGAENEGLTSESGEVSNQQVGSQSRVEESLSVALPADLSVETPALSLWPSLPNPQHSTGQMLSQFPGVPPSHFPCYEMNPMLGGPIFAFGPHDETTGAQSQSQKNSAPGSGPLGAWQQCHSGVDSFYGPPAGFTGPFISPSGGIPGVQGPPHMVVYNHFTPVGQFGQVGLSFMGATYIPSGKQPDWKHNPTPSASISEGDMNNLNIPSVQHNPTSMSSSIQHLAPGSPLLPLPSPLTMFDMSPFQSSTDVSVQGRWSHFPASPLHSAPLSMPMPQHVEGVLSSSFSQGSSTIDQASGNRFHESCSSATSDHGRSFSGATSAAVTQFPEDLGLLDTSSTTTSRVSVSRPASYKATIMNGKGQSVATKNLSRNTTTNAGDTSITNSNSSNSNQGTHSSVTSHSSQQQLPAQQYHQQTGYASQRGTGVSQKVASGSEWSQRKTGFQGRNQSAGTEKKVKQIYVAKSATSRTSTNSSS